MIRGRAYCRDFSAVGVSVRLTRNLDLTILWSKRMRATLRLAALTISVVLTSGQYAVAQNPPPPQGGSFTPGELVREGHRFFGTVSRGLAQIVETAVGRWGQPNGYVLGQEGGGAFVVGLRYGDGKLYTKNAGDRRVFWEGPSAGFDAGAEGARTMMLVYNLPAVDAVYQRFAGIDGSAYFIGGFGMTALASGDLEPVLINATFIIFIAKQLAGARWPRDAAPALG